MRCDTWRSYISMSATWWRVKFGRTRARECSHAAPLLAKMPPPKTGVNALVLSAPRAKSSKLAESKVLTFSGSIVIMAIYASNDEQDVELSGRKHTPPPKNLELRSVMVGEEPFTTSLKGLLLLSCLDPVLDDIEAKKSPQNAFVWIMICRLASMLLDHSSTTCSSGEFVHSAS